MIQQMILAAKLYKASPRQDQIKATMANPNNGGLMVQLARYLDEDYKTPENLTGKSREELEAEKTQAEDSSSDGNPDKNEGFIRESAGGNHGGGGGHISGLPEGMDLVDAPSSESDLDALEQSMSSNESSEAAPPPDAEPAEASTELEPIRASTDIGVDTVKSSLNNVSETAGVQRVAIKNNELWLYYDDDKNLNNIMTPVIDLLLKLGYVTLEFNRLARSDNAIVFEIAESATVPEVKDDEEGQ